MIGDTVPAYGRRPPLAPLGARVRWSAVEMTPRGTAVPPRANSKLRTDFSAVSTVLGNPAWRWELERLKERSAVRGEDFRGLAIIYALLGEKDQAFEWLEKGYQKRSHEMAFMQAEPLYDPLRSDPRFKDLLRRMNFPP